MFPDSSSVHHQEFFTVHTAVVYVIQFASRTRMELIIIIIIIIRSVLILLASCMTYTIAVCTVKNS